jgi:transposase
MSVASEESLQHVRPMESDSHDHSQANHCPLLTSDGQPYSAHQAERYDRYLQVVALRKQGMKIKEIASRIGIGRRTVQSWLAHDSYPETHYHRPHRSRFDTYASYVRQRWDEGCHNIQQLWREIKTKGYPHSCQALRAHLKPLHPRGKADVAAACSLDRFSAKKAVWLFIRRFDDLDEKEREELAAIRQASEMAEILYQLVQAFLQMVRKLQGEHLESWLRSVRASPFPELHSFANGLQRDKAAVLVGLTSSHNNDYVA